MENIFKNAYFGKPYKTRDDKKVLYHGSENHKSGDGKVWTYHYLMMEPETININGEDMVINYYGTYINDNGIGRFASLKYYKDSGASTEYDIISEWQEEIDEEELGKLANDNADVYGLCFAENSHHCQVNRKGGFYDGFKAGYRKAKEE